MWRGVVLAVVVPHSLDRRPAKAPNFCHRIFMNGGGRTGFAGVESVWNGHYEAVGIAFA